MELGKMIETHARHAIHERAKDTDALELRGETRRVRELLEREKGTRNRRGRKGSIDIKYAAGGMLDVYFATRYLQLRDDVSDEGDDRSTQATLERLESTGSLSTTDYDALSNGYALLRSIDHQLRLIAGKVSALPAPDYPTFKEIAQKLTLSCTRTAEALRSGWCTRHTYARITVHELYWRAAVAVTRRGTSHRLFSGRCVVTSCFIPAAFAPPVHFLTLASVVSRPRQTLNHFALLVTQFIPGAHSFCVTTWTSMLRIHANTPS